MKIRPVFMISLCLIFWSASCAPQGAASATLPPPASPRPTQPAATEVPVRAEPSNTPSPVEPQAWYLSLDPSYAALKYSYALVTNPEARMYLSLEGAQAASPVNKRLPKAQAYVSYTLKTVRDGKTFYQLASGDWMRAQDLQEVIPSSFSGIRLTQPLDSRFGWVLEATQSIDTAGNPVRGYSRYQVVRADPGQAQKAGYLAVGPDEWLPEDQLSLVTPGFQPPSGVDSCRFVLVDLAEQNLSVYDGCRLVFATLISSGRQFGSTPIGTFTVFKKMEYDLVTPPFEGGDQYYLDNVPFIDYFYGVWALHAAYWHDQFGFPASHGCINLAPADAHWLYDWIKVWDRVIVLPPG